LKRRREMKKILVPVDFSEASEIAVKTASAIADKTGAEIHLLHVTEEVVAGDESNNFKQQLQKFRSEIKGVRAQTFVTDGVPYDDVVSHAEEHHIDLIILCSDGTASYHSSYTASNILRITRPATCPVLIVPKQQRDLGFSKIVFVSDFTFEYDYREKVLDICCRLKSLTKDLSPEIDLLFIVTENCDEEKIIGCMEDFGKECGLKDIGMKIEKAGSVEEGARNYAEKSGADIIAMIGHGSGNYYTQLRTSISEKIIEKAEIPVMIFRIVN
jgi:nucleotide-binding universal stress UspA family protein